jgi:branched-subunit amino acid ABC-type transport system permease component
MDSFIVLSLETLRAVATLALISIGLAIIFGMMRVINLAHGEFLMLGGYAAIMANKAGINIWIATLVVAPLVVGAIGIVIERTIIRFLYGRPRDTMLATWGLSLLLIGITTTVFGNTTEGISAPAGSLQIGHYHIAAYSIIIVLVAVMLFVAIWLILNFTRYGLIARSTMQNPNMAAALGVHPPVVYAVTFGVGAGLAGLAGGVIAPLTGIVPTIGAAYVAKAFITVIGGGPAILVGTLSAAGLFGAIDEIVTYISTPVIGEVALLAAALVLLRVMPEGITGRSARRGS